MQILLELFIFLLDLYQIRFYAHNVFRFSAGRIETAVGSCYDIYCSSPYYDSGLLNHIFISILNRQTDIKEVALRIKETLMVILLMSFGAKKRFDLIKVNADLLEQQAELKKNEALKIQNPDVINDESFIIILNSIKEKISSLEKKRKE